MTRVIDARSPRFKKPSPVKPKREAKRALSPTGLLRVLAVLGLASALLLMALRWEIGTIRVRNATVTRLDKVATVLRPYLGSPLLLADRAAMETLLREDPWVRDVRVQLRPPSSLLLDVVEAQPLFRLPDGDAVDAEGRRLPAREGLDLSALPLLRVDRLDERATAQLRELSAALREVPWNTGAPLRELRIEREGLRLELDDGVQIQLGHFAHRDRLARLGAARAQLHPRAGDVLDLRFSRQIVLQPREG